MKISERSRGTRAGTACRSARRTLTVSVIFQALSTLAAWAATPPPVTIAGCPSTRLLLASPVELAWSVPASGAIEYRHKLSAPADWKGGIRHLAGRWSDWGSARSVRYQDFVVEGDYGFEVEARWAGDHEESRASCSWQVYWEYPEIREEAIAIDWGFVDAAPDSAGRLSRLAEEYRKQHEISMRECEYETRILKLSSSPQELVIGAADAVVDGASGLLMAWADRSASVVVGKLFLPSTVYEVIRAGARDLALVAQNQRANQACFRAVAAAYAESFYRSRAR